MRPGVARSLGALALAGLLQACVTFHDHAGRPIRVDRLAELEVGATTRDEVLLAMGPPTGVFDTNLLSTLTRANTSFEQPITRGQVDDDVLAWQELDLHARVIFFPVLFTWATSEVTSRTLLVFFDEQGRVRDVAYREDRP